MANYYVLLTNYGKQVIANAHANQPMQLTHVVIGDANNQPYLPESRIDQTTLVHETARLPINEVSRIDDQTAEVTVLIPSQVGGFNLHEVGILDNTGKLVYVGNFHGGYRPMLTQGAGGDMELIFTIRANNFANVIIQVDPTAVGATKTWLNKQFSLLLDALIPIGYPYWSSQPINPKPKFDLLLGKETYWRWVEGAELVAIKDGDANIGVPRRITGKQGITTGDTTKPDLYPLYPLYLWVRIEVVKYNGKTKANGLSQFM